MVNFKDNVLVTGGCGYIGSHTTVELLCKGQMVVIIDNLSNSNKCVIEKIEKITGHQPVFLQGDVRDKSLVIATIKKYAISQVVHFAGLKSVKESVENPIEYYDNNVFGTISLVEAMIETGVRTLVFSSSATVYGAAESCPITESSSLRPINPYGKTKLILEGLLQDLYAADSSWKIAVLRYFNPIGAHESGEIGEDPSGEPNNLLPYISQVALGKSQTLKIFGKDYPTSDGTGIRDYIHVVDLARGHLAALHSLEQNGGVIVANLGTGVGHSVLEIVKEFEIAAGKKIDYEFSPRRPGDTAICFADPRIAKERLGWQAEYDIKRMCVDTWRWIEKNPDGYSTKR